MSGIKWVVDGLPRESIKHSGPAHVPGNPRLGGVLEEQIEDKFVTGSEPLHLSLFTMPTPRLSV